MIPYVVTATSVTIIIAGKPTTIVKENADFDAIIDLVKNQKTNGITPEALRVKLDTITNAENTFKQVTKAPARKTKGIQIGIDKEKGVVHFTKDGKRYDLERNLSLDFIRIAKAKKSTKMLRLFIENIAKNPNPETLDNLFAFIGHQNLIITEDGHFLAYRGVTADYKDGHTGKFDNSVGQKPEMPRDQCDHNRNNTCSRGFHAGSFSYAKDWATKTMLIKINPADIVSVPHDYHGQKMRMCKYEVVAEVTGIKEPLSMADVKNEAYFTGA